MTAPKQVARRPFSWPAMAIGGAVFVWGVYLAVGAATRESQDIRKSAMILGCTIAFLVFWLIFLRRTSKAQSVDGTAIGDQWNVASVYSLISGIAVNCLVAPVYFAPEKFSDLTQCYFLLAALLVGGSCSVAAIIGLSRPIARRGQRLAFLAMLLLVVGLFVAIAALKNAAANSRQVAERTVCEYGRGRESGKCALSVFPRVTGG